MKPKIQLLPSLQLFPNHEERERERERERGRGGETRQACQEKGQSQQGSGHRETVIAMLGCYDFLCLKVSRMDKMRKMHQIDGLHANGKLM